MKLNNSTVYINLSDRKTDKKLPVLYDKKEQCCGCGACYAVCPVSAIEMKEDEEGFLYPAVYSDKCIGCYKCMKVCVFKVHQKK